MYEMVMVSSIEVTTMKTSLCTIPLSLTKIPTNIDHQWVKVNKLNLMLCKVKRGWRPLMLLDPTVDLFKEASMLFIVVIAIVEEVDAVELFLVAQIKPTNLPEKVIHRVLKVGEVVEEEEDPGVLFIVDQFVAVFILEAEW